jgi:hypothetical protein
MNDALLLKLLDRSVSFHPVLVDVTGSVCAALMLSQALYWTPRTSDDEGWFYKKQDEWQEETRLSRYEQEGARKKLLSVVSPSGAKLWHEELRGLPAKMYYRVDLGVLGECLEGLAAGPKPRPEGSQKPANKYAETPHTGSGKPSKQVGGKPASTDAENPHTFYITESTSESTSENTSSSSAPVALLEAEESDDDDPGPATAIFSAWENSFESPLTEQLKSSLLGLMAECGAERVIRAILRSVEYNGHTFAYVAKVARNDKAGLSKEGVREKERRQEYANAPAQEPEEEEEDLAPLPADLVGGVTSDTFVPAPMAGTKGNDEPFTPPSVWQECLNELQVQMPPATFESWVASCFVLEQSEERFVIGVPNRDALDWVKERMAHTIKRTLGSLVGHRVDVLFQFSGGS